jgi:GT2 family glycosyltransferase
MNASHLDFDLDRVVVVDNASTDGSLGGLDNCRLPLTVIRNSVNRGFAAGCNQGSAGTRADYLLFLNPDVLLCDRSLEVTIRFMEERAHSDVGICGVRLFDQKGNPTVAAGRFPTAWIFLGEATGLRRIAPALFQPQLLSPDECQTTHDVDQIIGAFFLVRRSLFDALSGFDERFFLYFEEVDFSLRARAMGHRSVLVADGAAVHRGGTSSEQIKATRMFYSLRSRLLYGAKHYSLAEYVLLTGITLGIEPISRLTLSMFRWRPGDVLDVLRAYGRLVAALFRSDRGRSLLDRRPNG